MSEITMVGIGCGNEEYLTEASKAAIENADILIGADRMLELVKTTCKQFAAVKSEEIIDIIEDNKDKKICVMYSGDTGFYSGATKLSEALREKNLEYRIIPGISSIQMMAARLGVPWQDWKLVSAHGRECNILAHLMEGKDTFFLTGGIVLPKDICRTLCMVGLGKTKVYVGERLSYADERLTEGYAEELSGRDFDKLAVMLVEAISVPEKQCVGIDDELFIRGGVPMTKRDVRASVMARMNVSENETVWDIGAGTGSISVELALAAKRGEVYAIECVQEGCELIAANREKFKVWNIHIVEGKAPEVLDGLPKPDAVFIGGTRGNLDKILDKILNVNPKVRLCITAIALESLTNSLTELTKRGLDINVTQISSSRSKRLGSYNMLSGDNPVFIITGGCNA